MTKVDEVKLAGGKRKNGHKYNCSCHICENMKNKARRGGYEDDIKKIEERKGGSRKKNGHRSTCKCPICKNMKNAKKGGRRTRKKRGGDGDAEDNDVDEKLDDETDSDSDTDSDTDSESDSDDEEEKGEDEVDDEMGVVVDVCKAEVGPL